MSISAFGAINPTALIVPGLYVQIVPPQLVLLNGVPTNVIGLVGSASWGAVNSPTQFGTMAQYASLFGPVIARTFDMGTAASLAVLQGANNFVGVRVTDGTDVAATIAVSATDAIKSVTVAGTAHVGDVLTLTITPAGGTATPLVYTSPATPTVQGDALALQALVNGNAYLTAQGICADTPVAGVFNIHYPTASVATVSGAVTGAGATTTLTAGSASTAPGTVQRTYTSLYTGSLGNSISVVESTGSAANTTRVSVSIPGRVPEVFDNIAGTGYALNVNIANAITQGVSGLRGPSQIITCTAGFGAFVTTPATFTPVGGTDGALAITTALMVGTDTLPRTGMYALRSQGASIGMLVDLTDSTSWSTQSAFAISEGVYMIATNAAGTTVAQDVTTKSTAALDTYSMKVMRGDWVFWQDQVNGTTRLVSPQGVMAGVLANMTPNQSSLNKQIFGIVGTQLSATGASYANADLQTLVQAGIDVIGAPAPGGNYFAALIGHNASSNATINGDNYTRMTNYIATTINSGMGLYVGQLNSPTVQANALATLNGFFTNLNNAGLIGTPSGTTLPWSLQLDNSNAALGLMQINVSVAYLPVVEKLLINVQGGQTVTINRVSTSPNI